MKKEVKADELQKEYNNLKEKQNTWTSISNLNKLYKVDHILLKFAYDNYPDKATLESSNQYKNIEKFYRNVLDRLFQIQKQYLTDGPTDTSTPYQINKNSTSKFIRDQNDHYKAIFRQFAQKINQDQLGINGKKVFAFIKKLFDTKYTAIIVNGENYFSEKANADRMNELQQTLKMYHVISKDMDEADFISANAWISEDQMLDFLSYWLKDKEDQHFYVLYCRTEEKLQKDIKYLKSQAKKNKKNEGSGEKKSPPAHPIQAQIDENQPVEDQDPSESQKLNTSIKDEVKKEENMPEILRKYRKNKINQDEQIVKPATPKPPPTKREQAESKLKEVFQMGCKRRYVLSKATTFDQIQNEGKTMNLEKFMNFCHHLKITEIVSKQLLSQLFKMYALNRLTIDAQRFQTIMERVMDTEKKVIDLILKKQQRTLRTKNMSQLSDYKFKLRPVNGKDPKSLKNELEEIRMAKSKSRQQKLSMFYIRKKQLKDGVLPGKKKKIVLSSYRLPEKTSLLEIENMRDDKFDPQKFFNNDFDDLLKSYESKIQKKNEESRIHPSLETVLSKRIERGARVVRKITSKNMKQYE